MLKVMRRHIVFAILMLICAVLLFYKCTEVRPFWFDEGWALSIARNWVEYGHYGERNGGVFVPSTILNTGFPATSLYAFTFWIFGVGALQARTLGNIIVILCLFLYYVLVNLLFDKTTALSALLLALLSGVHPFLNPILSGRQALGEMPMIMYVLTGFVLFGLVRQKHPLYAVIPSVFFSLAIHTKPQILPFLIAGLIVGIGIEVFKKNRKNTLRFASLLSFTLVNVVVFGWLWSHISGNFNRADAASTDPYSMVRNLETLLLYVVVLRFDVRVSVLSQLGSSVGLTGLVGIVGVFPGFAGRTSGKTALSARLQDTDTVVAMIWCMTALWYLWWILISNGWPRYVAPSFFLASMFVARWAFRIYESSRWSLRHANLLFDPKLRLYTLLTLTGAGLVIGLAVFRTLVPMFYWYKHANSDFVDTVAYLNSNVTPDELIETYESELFFLLEPNYHFPPDEIQHVGVRREYYGEDVAFDYDISYIHPEYIVTGIANSWWQIYDTIVTGDNYETVYENDSYRVYRLADPE